MGRKHNGAAKRAEFEAYLKKLGLENAVVVPAWGRLEVRLNAQSQYLNHHSRIRSLSTFHKWAKYGAIDLITIENEDEYWKVEKRTSFATLEDFKKYLLMIKISGLEL